MQPGRASNEPTFSRKEGPLWEVYRQPDQKKVGRAKVGGAFANGAAKRLERTAENVRAGFAQERAAGNSKETSGPLKNSGNGQGRARNAASAWAI